MPFSRRLRGRGLSTGAAAAALLLVLSSRIVGGGAPSTAEEGAEPATNPPAQTAPEEEKVDLAKKRLEVMKEHALGLRMTSATEGWPERLEPAPIFRYDDQTRGYVDGTVWRLGARGRPLAVVTTELHPNYLGGGSRVIYDLLSLTPQPFEAVGGGIRWSPMGAAVAMQRLPNGPIPADTPAGRLSQMKKLSLRFTATQDLEETDRVLVHLRRLPREIDRYTPAVPAKPDAGETIVKAAGDGAAGTETRADGGIFLFVNGRNPAILLLIETDGKTWSCGAGRLSAPSTLTLLLDDEKVWSVPPSTTAASQGYSATNVPARFP